MSKTFYASHNTKIPAIVSGVTVVFNVILSLFLVQLIKTSEGFSLFFQAALRLENVANLGVVGLALAFASTLILESFLLLYLLYKKFPKLKSKDISDSLYKIIIASAIMAFFTYLTRELLVQWEIIELNTFWAVFFQLALSGAVGVLTYAGATYFLKSPELKTIYNSFIKKFLYPAK